MNEKTKISEEKPYKKSQITCTRCPAGCLIDVSQDKLGNITDVEGQTCVRGKKYAINEVTNPVRTITAVIYDSVNLEPVSVKTENPVPKNKMHEIVETINTISLKQPVKIGEIIMEDICNTGVNLVATKSIN